MAYGFSRMQIPQFKFFRIAICTGRVNVKIVWRGDNRVSICENAVMKYIASHTKFII